MPNSEKYYIEDFKCFRHYVLCYQRTDNDFGLLSIDSFDKNCNDITTIKASYKKYSKKEPCDRTFNRVIIFENIDNIKTADFYMKESSDWNNNYIYFKNKFLNKFIPKDYNRCKHFLYFMKLNYKWEIKNISENHKININGTTINYRIADIFIPKSAVPKKRYRKIEKKEEI